MNRAQSVALAVTCLFVGGAGGWLMKPVPADPTLEREEKLRAFVDQDLRRYGDARSVEDKLRAADELYNKAVLLFLADLGLRVAGLPPTATPVVGVEKTMDPESAPVVEEGDPEAPIAKTEIAEANIHEIELAKKSAKDGPPALPTPKGDRLDNLMSYQRSPVSDSMTPEVRRLNGHFEGSFHIESGKAKGRVDTISMTVDVAMAPKLSGDINVKIARPDGTVWSNGRNNGTVQSLRQVPGKKDFIYIEPAPGDFILLDTRDDNLLKGDYYGNDGNYLGRVQLQRR